MATAELAGMERLFQALADRTRLRLLHLLRGREVCVCFFVEALRTSQPKISRHLAYLRRAGLVEARRDGKWMHYSLAALAAPHKRIVDEALDSIGSQPELQRDLERLGKACCSTALIGIRGAPLPTPSTRKKSPATGRG